MQKLSVIFVSFNTKELLEKNLTALFPQYENLEVIVVDNGSSDNSAGMVAEHFPRVKLIRSTNTGLASGSNIGLAQATGDYILYLGTDCFPEPGVLKGLVDFMNDNPTVGISTCKLVLRSGKTDMDAHRGFPTPWASLTHFTQLDKLFPKSRIFNSYFLGFNDMDSVHEIDLCISHFMLVRKEVFEKVGKWDEKFFVYGEDVDFCYRVKQSGFKIMYVPMFKALHYKGAGVGIRKETQDVSKASAETKSRMRRETTLAMGHFYKKHFEKKYPFFINWIVYFGVWVLGLLRNLRG